MFNRDSVFTDTIQLGQRVRCALPYCGFGTVVEIHGEQSPESCKTIGGVGVMGGNASLAIVWENGKRSTVPETLARSSIQWEVLPEVVSAQDVADALAFAEQTQREDEEAKARADRAHEEAKEKLAEDAELVGLKRADQCDEYAPKIAAANLRKLLKKRWPGVKFSVRMERGAASLRVSWTDGPTQDEVEILANSFQRGSFDSMTDGYDYHRSPFVELFGGADYVFCEREMSAELIAQAIEAVWQKYPANVSDVEKPTPEGIASGRFSLVEVPGLWEPVSRLVRQEAASIAA